MSRSLSLLGGLALAIAVSAAAEARDFEMGGDSPYVYSTTAPPPKTVTYRREPAPYVRHARSHQAAKPLAQQ